MQRKQKRASVWCVGMGVGWGAAAALVVVFVVGVDAEVAWSQSVEPAYSRGSGSTSRVSEGQSLFAQHEAIEAASADEALVTGGAKVLVSAEASRPSGAGRGESGGDGFEGYDFGHVVERMEGSVSPLQREMQQSFRVFLDDVRRAEQMLEEGRTRDAVQTASAAIDGVMVVRDSVLEPIWEGQEFLNDQIGRVRVRLARAVAAGGHDAPIALDQRTESMLDAIARRVATEQDSIRKARLVAHYRSVRNLAQIRRLSERLSPDQRRLWTHVLRVLEQASLAHQQLLMGTEVLFAQLEATSANLKEYLKLLETVKGASELIGVVRGLEDQGEGMAAFAQNMDQLQQRLSSFNRSVESALQSSMTELESQVDALDSEAGASPLSPMNTSGSPDAELESRLERLGLSGEPEAEAVGGAAAGGR